LVLDQANHLILPRLRLNELRILLVVLQQPVLERGQPKEPAQFLSTNQRRLVVGTQPVVLLVLLLGLELLAALAVPALIRTLVDVAVVVHLLNELSAALLVPLGTRLDENVMA